MTDIAWEVELAHIVLVRDTPVDVPTLFHLRNGLVLLPNDRPIGWDVDATAPPLPVRRAG
jgi:hypothetical protein